jgi:hypothetical protein
MRGGALSPTASAEAGLEVMRKTIAPIRTSIHKRRIFIGKLLSINNDSFSRYPDVQSIIKFPGRLLGCISVICNARQDVQRHMVIFERRCRSPSVAVFKVEKMLLPGGLWSMTSKRGSVSF